MGLGGRSRRWWMRGLVWLVVVRPWLGSCRTGEIIAVVEVNGMWEHWDARQFCSLSRFPRLEILQVSIFYDGINNTSVETGDGRWEIRDLHPALRGEVALSGAAE
jgi:hypothetical protein